MRPFFGNFPKLKLIHMRAAQYDQKQQNEVPFSRRNRNARFDCHVSDLTDM